MRRIAVLALIGLALTACGRDGASVSLRSPADGATVAGGVTVDMTADGITIEEAGEANDGAGHFHVIVDDGCVSKGEAVPKDADHVHFGKGQASGTVYLSPGDHELCLQAADGLHMAMNATDTIKLTAGVTSRDEWCKVAGEVDVLFEETDSGGAEFAVRQVSYENIGRLVEQMQAALDQVDAAARADVEAALKVVKAITSVYVDASNDDEAATAFEQVLTNANQETMDGAAPWISDTCGIDINS